MDRAIISEALRDLYNEDTGASLDVLGEEVALIADLGLDSVDVVSLIMQVERQFRIRLNLAELNQVQTFGDLLDLVTIKLQRDPGFRAA
ncbi:MAG: acpP 5 [Planctomycetaceae bacterium]|nr:acpP 5 [Planctomycetaceae bacterium]